MGNPGWRWVESCGAFGGYWRAEVNGKILDVWTDRNGVAHADCPDLGPRVPCPAGVDPRTYAARWVAARLRELAAEAESLAVD